MTKTEIVTITIRVTEKTAQSMASIHGNKSHGAETAVNVYSEIRPRILKDMKGQFSREELSYLLDIGNAHFFQPEMSSVGFWTAQIDDADQLDGYGEKWNVDVPNLIKKIKSLNPAEIYFWQEIINIFWYGDREDSPDLETFLDKWC